MEIDDVRTQPEFRTETFSGYKKCDVKKELLENLCKNKIENCCHWTAELICSGHFMDLWEIILLYFSKYIHSGNPKLAIYIEMRYTNFKDILNSGYLGRELNMRNNEKIRKLFCEIICNLCLSTKKHSFEKIKIKKEDFDMTMFSEKLKAPNVLYIKDIFTENDPKEIYIALNELAYNITIKNAVQCCFWIEWILEFENICNKKKEKCQCSYRTFMNIDNKYQNDIVWIIWQLIFTNINNIQLDKIMKSLLNLFCIRYSYSIKRKRIYILYYAITLCCENINYDIPLFRDKDIIENVCGNINIIYKDIKKNEVSPNTDYLFDKVGKSNTEKTIERLEKMKELDTFT
tara:strand:- start:2345 stop:3382 length:1038 start_codon:yes stop_codon:yes gene_type:complete